MRGAFSDGDARRLPAAVDAEMEGAFRTPTLRCVAGQPSFMHTAHITYARAGRRVLRSRRRSARRLPRTQRDTALGLDARERADLVAFLGTLEGAGPAASLLVAP